MVKRTKLNPYIDHGAKVWLTRYAKRNLWRVRAWYELEDLIQEGFVVFCCVWGRYHSTAVKPAHIMRLFQVSFINHIHALSKQRTRDPAQALTIDLTPRDADGPHWFWSQYAYTYSDEHRMLTLMAHAPVVVKRALGALSRADAGKLRSAYRRSGSGARETTNERLCRLANLNPAEVDVATAIRDYLAQ